jgi:hypothetical protein
MERRPTRGPSAARRLIERTDDADADAPCPVRTDLGGESPCFAHLFDEQPD